MNTEAILLGDGYGEEIGVINIKNLSTAKILEIAALGVKTAFGKKVKTISAINWRELENGGTFFSVQLVGETSTIDMPVTLTTILN